MSRQGNHNSFIQMLALFLFCFVFCYKVHCKPEIKFDVKQKKSKHDLVLPFQNCLEDYLGIENHC